MPHEQSRLSQKSVKPKRRKRKTAPLTRSENMSRIRGKDTEPEMILRRALWSEGLRYRLHDKHLIGKPDVVFNKYKTVIFVHGCFWHMHAGCKDFKLPKNNRSWWKNKLEKNRARDLYVKEQLSAQGWKVLTIWECELGSKERINQAIDFVKKALR